MKKILFIVFLAFLSVSLTAEALFMPDDKNLSELVSLYTEAGYVFPANSFPLSRNRLIHYAEKLLEKDIEETLKNRLNILIEDLTVKNKDFSLELDWQVVYEHYFRTQDVEYDLLNDYLAEEPLGRINIALSDYDFGGLCLEATLRREYGQYPDSNLSSSVQGNPFGTENQFVSKGYVWNENENIQLLFGRTAAHWGEPVFSSLLPSDNLPFLDQAKIDLFIGDFMLQFYAATLENREALGDVDLSAVQADTADSLYYVDFEQTMIWSMMHRLVYSLDTVRISLAEHIFVARSGNELNLGDLFPLTVWHNANVGYHNLSMVIDVDWVVVPGFELFFQAGFDDINAQDLFGIADSGLPTIDAYILGLYYTGNIFELPFKVTVEAGQHSLPLGQFL